MSEIYLLPYEIANSNGCTIWRRRIFGSQTIFAYVKLNRINGMHYVYCSRSIDEKRPMLVMPPTLNEHGKRKHGMISLDAAKARLDSILVNEHGCILISEERVRQLELLA